MRLSAGDFADLTGRVAALPGATGRLVAFLEGGYDPAAVRSSVGACAARLAGGSYRPEPATSGGAGMARIPGYRAMFVEETSA
jgi:acetoin utilization deacetylase AcuC-like enzyme